MLGTVPRPGDKGIFPLSSSVCHSWEAGEHPTVQLRCILSFFPKPHKSGSSSTKPTSRQKGLGLEEGTGS